MTFTDFMAKYNGKYVDCGGSENAKNQCVDEANAYLTEVLGQPAVMWTNAKDFPTKLLPPKWEYILNTPTGVPHEGDLVIWGGTYGHIANFIEGNTSNFRSYDQNYPSNSPCHVQNHTSYANVTGWLRFKGTVESSTALTECLAQHTQLVDKCNEKDKLITELTHQIEGLNAKNISFENFQKTLSLTLNSENQTTSIMGKIVELIAVEDTLRKSQKEVENLKSIIEELKEDLKTADTTISTQLNDLGVLQAEIEALQKTISTLLEKEKKYLEENKELKEKCTNTYRQLFGRIYLKTN